MLYPSLGHLAYAVVFWTLAASSPVSSPDSRYVTPYSLDGGDLVHYLDPDVAFGPGSGWSDVELRGTFQPTTSVLASNRTLLPRKSRSSSPAKQSAKSTHPLDTALEVVTEALKGIGDAIGVIITWYTGKDLQNPSCWAKSVWTPTDESMVCALTLKGWKDRPQCLDFIELCTKVGRCVFVRVVDSCAGCAPGSKHVDLTKGAFTRLGKLDTGIMNVKMRKSTQPKKWDARIYGPRH